MRFILAVVSMWTVGAGAVLWVKRRTGYRFALSEIAGLSLLTGMGAVALVLFAYGMYGINFDLLNFSVIPAAVFIILGSGYAARPSRFAEITDHGAAGQRWTGLAKFLMAALVLQAVWVVVLAMAIPVSSHDAVANYALKARIFYFEGGIPPGFFTWAEETVAHPDYPLLLPFVMTWIYAFTGFNDLAIKALMPLVYGGFLMVFFARMRKLFDPSCALLSVFILATIPQLSDYATIIHADLALTAFITCGMIYFMSYIRDRGKAELVFCSALMGFSLWVKNEAIVFTAAFICSFAALVLRSRGESRKSAARDMFLSAAVIAVIAVPWFAVRISSGAVNSDLDISALTAGRVLQNIKDIPLLLNLFQQEVFGPKKWNIFWVMFFASLIWKRKDLRLRDNFYIAVFLLVSAAGYFAGYMATTGENLYFYVNTTISRFMLHFSGVSAVLMWSLVYGEIRKIKFFNMEAAP